MTAQEFLSNVSILVGFMVLVSALELAVPLFARGAPGRRRLFVNLGLTAVTFLSNWLLLSIAGDGPVATLAWPPVLAIAASVVVLDLSTYLAHVTMHALPALWSVHRLHHEDRFLDVTTTFRQHPVEGLWRFLWIAVPVFALGLPAAGVVVYRLLSATNAVLEHANLRVWAPLDRLLSLVWTTPNMHKVHHSRVVSETNSNYGNILAVFDRGFGTFTPTVRAFGVTYGLDDGPQELDERAVGLGRPLLLDPVAASANDHVAGVAR